MGIIQGLLLTLALVGSEPAMTINIPEGWKVVNKYSIENQDLVGYVKDKESLTKHSEFISSMIIKPKSKHFSIEKFVKGQKNMMEGNDCKVDELEKSSRNSRTIVYECASAKLSGIRKISLGSDRKVYDLSYEINEFPLEKSKDKLISFLNELTTTRVAGRAQ